MFIVWLLVGAPLAQNKQPGTNRSGALFKCPVDTESRCIQVETDGHRATFDYTDEPLLKAPVSFLLPPGDDEIKDGQWMGVNVRSQGPGGTVMVCAHRYVWSTNLTNNQYGLGICYSLDENLVWDSQWEPCKGRAVAKGHEQFGFCQAGTSLALLNDGTALIGSPGPYTWRGTMFLMSTTGDFLSRDRNIYLGPLNNQEDPLEKYSYLGMSVAAGKFFRDQNISYAAGAPRSKDHGQVFFFNKKNFDLELNVFLIINGQQFASSFGYEIVAVDINNDGFDDLIVGAPFYFNQNEGGAVYIYSNLKDCARTKDCKPDNVLKGAYESRFGFSIASVGDINRDGYIDIAIGAPYEGNGAIYIYLGSKDGLSQNFSQKIHPEWPGIRTLGYSLSGGLDIDNNGYPDLLSGAYDSSAAILFKARPIIDIQNYIEGEEYKNINTTNKGCEADRNSNNTCFSFGACFRISSTESLSTTDNLRVQYEIEAETFEKKKFSRVWFRNLQHPDSRWYRKQDSRILTGGKRGDCFRETVYITEGTRDILSPIKFRVIYSLADKSPHSAILNQTSVKDFEATFQKDCGNDDKCESKLIMTAELKLLKESGFYFLNLGSHPEVELNVNVTNEGDPAYEAQLFVMHPASLVYRHLSLDNVKCMSKNVTIVICSLGNPLQAHRPISVNLKFEPFVEKEAEVKFDILVNSTSIELSDQTKTSLVAVVKKKAEINITSSAIQSVFYGGEVKGESAMHHLDDIGPRVRHTYEIVNGGPWRVLNLEVDIHWPHQVANKNPEGKWLLYLEDIPKVDDGQSGECVVTNGEVNPLQLKLQMKDESENNSTLDSPFLNGSSILARKRREKDYVVVPETRKEDDGKERKVVVMDCKKKTAKCIKLKCTITKLDKGGSATIQVISRLWNSTLVEDYSKVDYVSIISRAEIKIPDDTIQQDRIDDDMTLAETSAYPEKSIPLDPRIPLWIYIVSVLGGMLLLIALSLILWWLGFFKRKRVDDPTLSGNLTKQSEQETLLNK